MGRRNSQNKESTRFPPPFNGAVYFASVVVHGEDKKQMLSRKRNSKTLYSWHFYAFLGALGDFRCGFRPYGQAVIRG
jgi:hypothetical protein